MKVGDQHICQEIELVYGEQGTGDTVNHCEGSCEGALVQGFQLGNRASCLFVTYGVVEYVDCEKPTSLRISLWKSNPCALSLNLISLASSPIL